jgi:hypothetical protein
VDTRRTPIVKRILPVVGSRRAEIRRAPEERNHSQIGSRDSRQPLSQLRVGEHLARRFRRETPARGAAGATTAPPPRAGSKSTTTPSVASAAGVIYARSFSRSSPSACSVLPRSSPIPRSTRSGFVNYTWSYCTTSTFFTQGSWKSSRRGKASLRGGRATARSNQGPCPGALRRHCTTGNERRPHPERRDRPLAGGAQRAARIADLYDTLIRLYIEPRLGRKEVREIDKGLILARARAQVNRCHRISGAVSLRCLLLCRNGRRAGRPYLVDTSPMMIGTGSSISSLVGSFGKRKSSASHLFRRVFEPLLIMNSASVSDLTSPSGSWLAVGQGWSRRFQLRRDLQLSESCGNRRFHDDSLRRCSAWASRVGRGCLRGRRPRK